MPTAWDFATVEARDALDGGDASLACLASNHGMVVSTGSEPGRNYSIPRASITRSSETKETSRRLTCRIG